MTDKFDSIFTSPKTTYIGESPIHGRNVENKAEWASRKGWENEKRYTRWNCCRISMFSLKLAFQYFTADIVISADSLFSANFFCIFDSSMHMNQSWKI